MGIFYLTLITALTSAALYGIGFSVFGWLLLILLSLSIIGLCDRFQTKHSILRNYPIIGHMRWLAEAIRPYFRQYLIEGETEGAPIHRMFRSIVYQRAKQSLDTNPFGTKVDTNRIGYEWLSHSLKANLNNVKAEKLRVTIGNHQCKRPYSASLFNISAMSFGAISANAVKALNKGAQRGTFYQNTGEGSLTPYHLEYNGDLVWQIGTGYFGCRDDNGNFDAESFSGKATEDSVKMIEIKLSQGAKPSHGGILPKEKITDEIARFRHVGRDEDVVSPPTHSAFSSPIELLEFINKLRQLSGGKPVGIKLCIGNRQEFFAILKAMRETDVYPDFITVDGGEGGTGAAPLEFSNSIGMPLRDAIVFTHDALVGMGLRDKVKIIASGKLFTSFHIVRAMALGADLCNSARGMMFALGCVQSLSCNTNRCPTGIATQNPRLSKGLVVKDKAERVYHYHQATLKATAELLAAAAIENTEAVARQHIFRRMSDYSIRSLADIYPEPENESFINGSIPKLLRSDFHSARAESF